MNRRAFLKGVAVAAGCSLIARFGEPVCQGSTVQLLPNDGKWHHIVMQGRRWEPEESGIWIDDVLITEPRIWDHVLSSKELASLWKMTGWARG